MLNRLSTLSTLSNLSTLVRTAGRHALASPAVPSSSPQAVSRPPSFSAGAWRSTAPESAASASPPAPGHIAQVAEALHRLVPLKAGGEAGHFRFPGPSGTTGRLKVTPVSGESWRIWISGPSTTLQAPLQPLRPWKSILVGADGTASYYRDSTTLALPEAIDREFFASRADQPTPDRQGFERKAEATLVETVFDTVLKTARACDDPKQWRMTPLLTRHGSF